jgi:hypothetical protein
MQAEGTMLPGPTEIYKDLQWPEGHELPDISLTNAIPLAVESFQES